MPNKYLERDATSGRVEEVSSIDTSAGAGDAGKIGALDSTGRWDQSMMPIGIGPDTATIEASEALDAGDFVSVWLDTTVKCRKADATTSGKEADGFVLDAVSMGANALVYFEGVNTQRTGMTIGARQYLATTAGDTVETPLSTTGNVHQYLGKAISATALNFEPSDAITLA